MKRRGGGSMKDFSLEQSGNVAVLAVSGPVTVERACELKEILMKALHGADQVVFDLEGMTEVDLSCLQMLCSAHRTSIRLNKRITLGNVRPEVFRRATECGGFERHTGCALDTNKSCLWVKGYEKNLV
jgi:anti-anti-sigma regulatory factor